mmetsp:Transcript_22164/g.51188  ORF Transcript_22164/g.51188 Transcript_22164/m.51188 type:complete len:95 (+) Transcript_22164:184-468(+)
MLLLPHVELWRGRGLRRRHLVDRLRLAGVGVPVGVVLLQLLRGGRHDEEPVTQAGAAAAPSAAGGAGRSHADAGPVSRSVWMSFVLRTSSPLLE